jgi:hypothetical protein
VEKRFTPSEKDKKWRFSTVKRIKMAKKKWRFTPVKRINAK